MRGRAMGVPFATGGWRGYPGHRQAWAHPHGLRDETRNGSAAYSEDPGNGAAELPLSPGLMSLAGALAR